MTRLLAALTAALFATLAPASAAPKDSIVIGMTLEPPMLDPTAGAAAAIGEVTYRNIFEGLTALDSSMQVHPLLAKSWTVSPDGLTYTFSLQPAVTFSDGARFDCSVVQFSYERAAAPDSVNAHKGKFEPIASVACPAPGTAVVTLKRPTGGFLVDMGTNDAVMVSPVSAGGNKTNPVGTGPYKLVRWAKGDRVELTRNPAYWGKRPAIDDVTFRFIADPSAATAAVMAGDVDAFPLFPAPETLDQFRGDKRFHVQIGTTSGKTIMSLNNARKPFDDVRVRRALAYAIDRKALVEALGSYGTPIGSHFVPGDAGYVDLTGAYPFDPAKARALLKEAGIKPGFTVTISLPPPSYARRGGEVIAAMLADVGITAKLVPIEWAQWLDVVFKQSDFDATIISHVEPGDIGIYARDKYYFNYHNPEFDALYKRYAEANDPAERLKLVEQLQHKLSADEPNVFLFALAKVGVWNAKLRGLWANEPIFANVVSEMSWTE
jgi:peptide/nickel transport system substrate-binding protein